MSTAIEVGLADLRRALTAVVPHADHGKEPIPQLAVVRLLPDGQNLTAMATDRFTVALGLVSILEHLGDGLDPIDLHYTDVAKVLAVFKLPGKESGISDEQLVVRIERDDEGTVTITDVGGMIQGQALTIPTAEAADFPDLVSLFGRLIRTPHRLDADTRSWVNVTNEAKFTHAVRAYGGPLVIERLMTATSGMHLVQVGDSFLGAMSLMRHDEAEAGTVNANRRAWFTRLPDAGGAAIDLADIAADHEARNTQVVTTSDTQLVQAAELVITTQAASPSMLQHKLGVSAAVAHYLLNVLEDRGIVNSADGTRAREVLTQPHDLTATLAALKDGAND